MGKKDEAELAIGIQETEAGISRILRALGVDDQWDSHPDYPREDWMLETGENDTSLGYWHWVANMILNAEEDDQP